jgi:hypothetical protein
MPINSVCIFCGSASGSSDIYRRSVEALIRSIAKAGLSIVYGGGSTGLMGVVADTAIAEGVHIVGVTTRGLVARELVSSQLNALSITDSIADRKSQMIEQAGAFIALPGGVGTLDELFEVMTLTQLGLQNKGFALLNVSGYFDPLLSYLEYMRREGFIHYDFHQFLIVDEDPEVLLQKLQGFSLNSSK